MMALEFILCNNKHIMYSNVTTTTGTIKNYRILDIRGLAGSEGDAHG